MTERQREISRFLTTILRNPPGELETKIIHDEWVSIKEVLKTSLNLNYVLTRETLLEVIRISPKHRFELSPEGEFIRLVPEDKMRSSLDYQPVEPLRYLYHGTARRNLAAIKEGGLKKFARNHVHLSPDEHTARRVSARHGRPVVLVIEAQRMFKDGYEFFHAPNDVWLVDHVPSEYIRFPFQIPSIKKPLE